MPDLASAVPALTSVEITRTYRDGSEITREEFAEPTANPHLVITPDVSVAGFSGHFVLTHLPSGRAITNGDPHTLRDLAERVAHLDWDMTIEELKTSETAVQTLKAIRQMRLTEPDGVELPAHPSWRRDEKDGTKRTALPLMADMLATFQWAHNRTGGRPDSVPSRVPDPDKPGETKPNPEWHYLIIRQVECYGLAYLLGALHQLDPEVADSAAASLADAWEAGDSLGEWAYEWAQWLAKGEPLNLPGIPDPTAALFADTEETSRG